MNILPALGLIFLAALTNAFLQLDLGGLLLLYHASMGKHVSKKTRSLSSSYILGVCFLVFLGLSAAAFFIVFFAGGSLEIEILSGVVGLLLAISLIVWFYYYSRGRSTELWLPRTFAHYIDSRAKSTSSEIEAFSLGMLTCVAEYPFSLILFVVAADSFISLPPLLCLIAILSYLLVSLSPLIICRFFIRHGNTVADVQKWRLKNKTFFRIIAGVCFAVLALFLLAFKILGDIL